MKGLETSKATILGVISGSTYRLLALCMTYVPFSYLGRDSSAKTLKVGSVASPRKVLPMLPEVLRRLDMSPALSQKPLIAIVGATGTGKSQVSHLPFA